MVHVVELVKSDICECIILARISHITEALFKSELSFLSSFFYPLLSIFWEKHSFEIIYSHGQEILSQIYLYN